jgi:hypothetical protein
MVAGNLASTLLGGTDPTQLGVAGTMDPAMLQAMPELQLAQTMLKSGLDTSPAHPLAALARVLQAGAGQAVQQNAIGELGKAYSGMAGNLSKSFPADHPIQKFLNSPDPSVRAMGIQAAQKALILQSEPQKLTPGEGSYVGPGNAPQAQNTGPQSPLAKVISDAQNNPAAAPILGRAVTKETTTPEGVSYPPTPIPMRAPVRPPVQQPPGTPQSPAGAPSGIPGADLPTRVKTVPITPNPTFDQRYGAIGDLPGQIAQAAGFKEHEVKAAAAGVEYGDFLRPKPVGQGPGQTEPVPTARGTVIPPYAEQAPLPKAPKEIDSVLGTWQKTKTDWNQGLNAGQQAEQRLQTIANTFKSMQTGSFNTEKAQLSAALKAVGINIPDKVLGDPAAVQLALHENYVETIQQLKAATPRFTQMEFKALSQNKEHPDLQPAANLQMLAEDIGTLRQARDLPTDFVEAQRHGWRDPQSFEQSWLRANPIQRYVDKVKTEIGPLRGMPGNTGAQTIHAPANVKTPAEAAAWVATQRPGTQFVLPDGTPGVVPPRAK